MSSTTNSWGKVLREHCPICQGFVVNWPPCCHTLECVNGHNFPMGCGLADIVPPTRVVDIDQLALDAAREIAAMKAPRFFAGGDAQRLAEIQCVVARAIRGSHHE